MLDNLFVNSSFNHLLSFFDTYKDLSILDLYKSFKCTNTKVSETFIKIVKRYISKIYGKKCAIRAKQSLYQGDCLFAANHGGFENLPYVLASSLLIKATSSYLNLGDNIIFTCNSITPKNKSYPSSVILDIHKHRINLLPRKYDQCFLDNVRAITLSDIQLKQDRIASLCQGCELQAFDKLQSDLLKYNKDNSFITQSSLLNTNIYNEFMPSIKEQNYYISIEDVARDCLLVDLNNTKSFICCLLSSHTRLLDILSDLADHLACFDKRLIDLQDKLNNLNNIYGTILFYAINEKKQKEQCKLIQEKDGLYLKSYSSKIKLNVDCLYEALALRRLVPNIYTINMSFMFEHNVKLVGGIFMSFYMKHMLEVTQRHLSLSCDCSYYDKNLISACIMPFANFNNLDLNYNSYALLYLDLFKGQIINSCDIERLLFTKLMTIKNFTLANIAIDNFNENILSNYKNELEQILDQGSCINMSYS